MSNNANGCFSDSFIISILSWGVWDTVRYPKLLFLLTYWVISALHSIFDCSFAKANSASKIFVRLEIPSICVQKNPRYTP